MYINAMIRISFCVIQDNQGLSNGYQPHPSASADNPYLNLDYSDITKTSSNNIIVYYQILNRPYKALLRLIELERARDNLFYLLFTLLMDL